MYNRKCLKEVSNRSRKIASLLLGHRKNKKKAKECILYSCIIMGLVLVIKLWEFAPNQYTKYICDVISSFVMI